MLVGRSFYDVECFVRKDEDAKRIVSLNEIKLIWFSSEMTWDDRICILIESQSN